MRVAAIIVALAVSVVGVVLFVRAVVSIVGVVKLGKPAQAEAIIPVSDGGTCWPKRSDIPACCSGPRSVPRTGSCSSPSAL